MYAAIVLALATAATAMPAAGAIQSINGMPMAELSWEMDAFPGMTFSGTIQDVYAQVLAIDPNFKAIEAYEVEPEVLARDLSKRRTYCGGYQNAARNRIQEGISYLRTLGARPVNDAGKCGRVSCSWNSAITWCNTGSSRKTLEWSNIANSAQTILNNCPGSQLSGREDHSDNWDGIVHGDSC